MTQGPSGLLLHENGRWFKIDRNHGLNDGEIAAVSFDREGSMWLGVRDQGVFRAVGLDVWENLTTTATA